MSTHRCPHCRWQGPVRIYNLVWSREWACPRCLHLVVEDTRARGTTDEHDGAPSRKWLRRLTRVAAEAA